LQLLAGDVGATKTKLAIFSSDDPHISAAQESTFPNVEYSSLDTLVQEFLSKVNDSIEFACFGVAGPIFQGSAKLTNLAWVIDEKELSASLKLASVRLLNDLQATAYYVPFLKPKEIETLNRGKPIYGGTIAVIAPGTGLGEAYLAWDGKRYHPHASEGGHGDFAPTNPSEIDLLSHLLSKFKHVSYERVCSGRGLYNIYKYYHESTQSRANGCPAEDKISEADDPTPPIVDAALHKKSKCGICVKTLDMFISILGAEAGNLGLKFMATSGVYVGGGYTSANTVFPKRGTIHASVLE